MGVRHVGCARPLRAICPVCDESELLTCCTSQLAAACVHACHAMPCHAPERALASCVYVYTDLCSRATVYTRLALLPVRVRLRGTGPAAVSAQDEERKNRSKATLLDLLSIYGFYYISHYKHYHGLQSGITIRSIRGVTSQLRKLIHL